MNNPPQGARLTFHSREQIVALVLEGQPVEKGTEDVAGSVRTVRKWLARFRAGGSAALSNRAGAPLRRPNRLPERTVAAVLYRRRTFRMTAPALVAWPAGPGRGL
ncbi:leucine zipper domain-containing protein [Tropicimonas sp. IMCC34043]|uniref:helix-turn-helix domain-containing protein n=1 Tax=Tropicimonas sp. IMCC34043 TaxID=2248760 RepID=UPI000E25E932